MHFKKKQKLKQDGSISDYLIPESIKTSKRNRSIITSAVKTLFSIQKTRPGKNLGLKLFSFWVLCMGIEL